LVRVEVLGGRNRPRETLVEEKTRTTTNKKGKKESRDRPKKRTGGDQSPSRGQGHGQAGGKKDERMRGEKFYRSTAVTHGRKGAPSARPSAKKTESKKPESGKG